jgi:hypothetical protein
MESYKYSCATCGQHVEYTVGYCGRQMQCPICGNTITFPAIPPKSGGKTIVSDEPKKPARNWAWDAKAIFLYLRDFPHWKIVLQIAVPFLIIAALLAGAAFVKNKFSDEPVAAAPVVEGQPGGWDKMTELARADQKMQQYVQKINQTRMNMAAAQRMVDLEQKRLSQARGSDEQQVAQANLQVAERSLAQAEKSLVYLRQHFNTDFEDYRRLGGTIDYISRAGN